MHLDALLQQHPLHRLRVAVRPWPAQIARQIHFRQLHGRIACSTSLGSGAAAPDESDSSASSSSGSGQEAWSLMGRVLSSDRLVLGDAPKQRLLLLAAARAAGLPPPELESRLLQLAALLPDLRGTLLSLQPATLAALAADTAGVADKLLRLRLLFPAADVSGMVCRRPTLLLPEQFEAVEAAREVLLRRLIAGAHDPSKGTAPSAADGVPCTLDDLVSAQPWLLVADVDTLLDELERLLPAVPLLAALQRDPSLVTAVMDNRRLSIW